MMLLNSALQKRKIIYHEDGRRFVGDKIENEQSVSNLWSTALTLSVIQDLKDSSNEDFTLRNLGLIRYGDFLFRIRQRKKERYISEVAIQFHALKTYLSLCSFNSLKIHLFSMFQKIKNKRIYLFSVSYLLQQFVSHRNIRTIFVLMTVNVMLILLFFYIFVF